MGSFFWGKTKLTVKNLKRKTDTDMCQITRSPEMNEEFGSRNYFLDFDECKSDIVVFEDIPIKNIDPVFARGRNKDFFF